MGTFAQRALLASSLGHCGSPVPITRDAAIPRPLFTLAAVLGYWPLRLIPQGLPLHNIEMVPGRGAQMVRSAGAAAICTAIDKDYALVRLPSGELRRLHADCYATVGQVGNVAHEKVSLGKAGRARWLGRRPHTRGMVMNPVDHPMGGGQGKSKGGGGRQHPVSPWGQLAKGLKTRHRHKTSSRFIVEDRRKKRSS